MSKSFINKNVFKLLDTVPPKQSNQISKKILHLFNDPLLVDSIPLKGYPDYRRVDIGEYRICYTYINNIISVDLIGKRDDDDVYQKIKRK